MGGVITITDAEFDTEVLQANQPVLVYFWADWCGPCLLMSPIMDAMAKSYGDRLKVVKMEVDPNPQSVTTYKVEGVPAIRLIQAGEVLEAMEGAIPKAKLEAMLKTHLGG